MTHGLEPKSSAAFYTLEPENSDDISKKSSSSMRVLVCLFVRHARNGPRALLFSSHHVQLLFRPEFRSPIQQERNQAACRRARLQGATGLQARNPATRDESTAGKGIYYAWGACKRPDPVSELASTTRKPRRTREKHRAPISRSSPSGAPTAPFFLLLEGVAGKLFSLVIDISSFGSMTPPQKTGRQPFVVERKANGHNQRRVRS